MNKVSVAVTGHHRAGKTTLLASLGVALDKVFKKKMEQILPTTTITSPTTNEENHLKKYTWILDKTKDERKRGFSVDPHMFKLDLPSSSTSSTSAVTFFDTPGHKTFFGNVMNGVSQSDGILFVVSAVPTELDEARSNEENSQLRSAIVTAAHLLNTNQAVIAVTKMDKVSFKEEEFNRTVRVMESLLNRYPPTNSKSDTDGGENRWNLTFVPVAVDADKGGVNVVPSPSTSLTTKDDDSAETLLTAWYKGPSLAEALGNISAPSVTRSYLAGTDRPFRLPIREVCTAKGLGTVVCGRIASGSLKPSDKVVFGPKITDAGSAQVESIQEHMTNKEVALPGDCIGFVIKGATDDFDKKIKKITRGMMCGGEDGTAALTPSKSYLASVTIVGHPTAVETGYIPLAYTHTAHAPCRFEFPAGGPQQLRSNSSGKVIIYPETPLYMEPETEKGAPHALSRFILRDCQKVIGFGTVLARNDPAADYDGNIDLNSQGSDKKSMEMNSSTTSSSAPSTSSSSAPLTVQSSHAALCAALTVFLGATETLPRDQANQEAAAWLSQSLAATSEEEIRSLHAELTARAAELVEQQQQNQKHSA